MKTFFVLVLLVLPALAFGKAVSGKKEASKVCRKVLVDGTVKQNVPDPNNCSQYYLCSKWYKAKKVCDEGLHFSAVEQKCTDPCLAGCDTSLVCTTTGAPEESTTIATTVEAEVETATADVDTETEADVTTEASSSDAATTDESASEAATDGAELTTKEPAVEAETAPVGKTDASTVTEQPDEKAETTTPFWYIFLKKFGSPPASLPAAAGAAGQGAPFGA